MTDDQLHRLLHHAPADAPVSRSFARNVWARIEAEDAGSLGAPFRQCWGILLSWLARPAPALVTIASCIVLGALLGTRASRPDPSAPGGPSDEMVYIRSINPLDRHGPGSHR